MDLNDDKNILVYSQNKDDFEDPETLKFLSDLNLIKFINMGSSTCEGKLMTGGYHGLPLNQWFAVQEREDKIILNYLK
ncbi:MAG: hypothetical protein O3C61_04120, partial [Proteobacteria bacterium]|nr:hypothetical protein [Pseudomonadota bacterium]